MLLPKKLRVKTYVVQIASIFSAILDIIGLGSMVPILMLAIDNNFLEKSSKLRFIYALFGFQTEAHFLIFLLIVIFCFFLIKNIFALWIQNKTTKIASEATIYLSENAYNHAFKSVTYSKINQEGLGFNDQLIFNPYYYISGVFLPLLLIISEGSVTFLMIALFGIFKPALFIPLALLMGTAVIIVMTYFKGKSLEIGAEIGKKREESLESINYGNQGFFDIRNYHAQFHFKKRFFDIYKRYVRLGAKANLLQLVPSRILELVTLSGIMLLVIYAYFVSDNTGEARAIAAMFVIAIFRLLPAANRLMQSFLKIRLNAYTMDRLKEHSEPSKIKPLVFKETVEIKNITIAYENGTILEFGHLELRAKQIVGIKGESGKGKTSLIRFLLGEIECSESVFKLDGNAVSVFDLSALMGSLSQQHFVFKGSVQQNVGLKQSFNAQEQEEIDEALEKASFRIDGVENIKEHLLENGGINLSEGQKQRLSIARLLYADNPIVLLDEPTSSLDIQNEKEIMKTVQTLANNGKALLIIAHSERMFEICTSIYEISDKKLMKIK
jgi:ABC-type multidrug transport system fused ATPase/permease subunit